MPKLTNMTLEGRGQKILAYGPPKCGKTLQGGLLAHYFEEVILLDFENGWSVLKQLPPELQAKVTVIKIPDNKANRLAAKFWRELSVAGDKGITICDEHGIIGNTCVKCKTSTVGEQGTMVHINPEKSDPSKTLYIADSMTQISTSVLSLAIKPDDKLGFEKASFNDYGEQGWHLDTVLTYIQQSRANWYFTSHEEALQMEDDSEKIIPLAGTRNFSRRCAKYFDHVVYMNFNNYKHKINSNGLEDMKVLSGSRSGVKIEVSTVAALYSLLRTTIGTDDYIKLKAELEEKTKPSAQNSEKKEEVKQAPAKEMNPALKAKLDAMKNKVTANETNNPKEEKKDEAIITEIVSTQN